MKINAKILSIPPYISTTWDQVSGLFFDEKSSIFHVTLKNGTRVSIPNLSGSVIEQAFSAHAEHLEHGSGPDGLLKNLKNAFPIGNFPNVPINLESLRAFTGMMQHDPSQKDAPDLPPEILDRVTQVSKALGLDQEAFEAPESEPHCNCPYCQIARVLHGTVGQKENNVREEDLIDDQELQFREWDIQQVAEKLYEVSNPFDKSEHYQVYLGQPIGCTCGKNNCEHILAVLNS